MNNKEYIIKYLDFKKECIDNEIINLEEIFKLFKIKLDQEKF